MQNTTKIIDAGLESTSSKFNYPVLRRIAMSVAFASLGVQTVNAATTYTAFDMTNMVTIAGFTPVKINNAGLIVGNDGASLNTKQYIYNLFTGMVGEITTLPTGDMLRSAVDINLSGQVVGAATLPGSTALAPLVNIFVHNANGTATDLGSFIGTQPTSTLGATAINDLGQVIGFSTDGTLCGLRAVTGNVNGGGLNQINSLAGAGGWSSAAGLNNQGQIVGSSAIGTVSCSLQGATVHAYVTTATGITDLQDPRMPGTPAARDIAGISHSYSSAYAINDSGLAVGRYGASYLGPARAGYVYGQPIFHAVVWDTVKGGYTDLGSGSLYSSLTDINASGQVIGEQNLVASTDLAPAATQLYPVVGSVTTPGLTDLNTLVTGLPTGMVISSALDINDAGQILAKAYDSSLPYVPNAPIVYHYLFLNPTTSVTPVAPVAPSGLTASAASSIQINLSWVDNAGTNETAQYVERCMGVGCTNFAQIATLAAGVKTYSDTGLNGGTSYSYRVVSHNTVGNSAYSNVVSATTAVALTAPAAPTNLISNAITNSKVALAWTDNSNNEQKFQIERCRGLGCTSFSLMTSVGANRTSYTDYNLRRGTNYSYRVSAINSVGKSAYSNILSVITLP